MMAINNKVLLLAAYIELKILDFRFWIGGIAWLYPIIKQIEYLKSKIRNPNFTFCSSVKRNFDLIGKNLGPAL